MAPPDQTKQQIIDLVSQFNADVRTTREDLTLSPLGRYRRLQTLYAAAGGQVAKLRSTIDTDTNGDRRTLERRLFGLPAGADAGDVVAFRDAQDRVAQARRAEDLGDLMERASSSGDDTLVRAGFARAWQESLNPLGSDVWAGLVSEYLDQYPAARREAEALSQLTSSRGKTQSLLERIGMTVSKPAELNTPEAAYSDQKPGRPEAPQLMHRGA